jgi:aryl-alcohol dehydrogenase-like predicted oxidoreductase
VRTVTLRSLGLEVSQLGLGCAGVPAQGEEIVEIAGTKRRSYREKNAAAVDVELAARELRRIDAAFPKGAAIRERLPGMSPVSR